MFKDSFRIERIYFEKLKTMIPQLQKLIANAQTEEARKLLENAVDSDGAILLLYRNLGEAWAELADLIEKLRKELEKQDERIQDYHDELNQKIDDVNNYLMQLIREINARLDSIEADLAEMQRVMIYDVAYDPTDNTNYVEYKHNRVTRSEILNNFNKHLLIFRYYEHYYYLDSANVHGTEDAIEARSLTWVDDAKVGYNTLLIFKHPETDFAIALTSESFSSFGSQYELTMTSLSGGTTDEPKDIIAEDFLSGRNVILHGNLQGIDVYLTVTGVYSTEISPDNYIYNIKAFGYDPSNTSIYIVDMPFTGGDYDFNLDVYPVIKQLGLGLTMNNSQLELQRTFFNQEKYTVVFSALSSSATMRRKETGETITFDDIAAACADGSYDVCAESVDYPGGQQNNPCYYLFNLEWWKNNEGLSPNYVMFGGWKGSDTRHSFTVYDQAGVTYGTVTFEQVP